MNKLIELANKLDSLGLAHEANAVDTIIKKIAADDDPWGLAGWPNPGTSADIDRGPPRFIPTRDRGTIKVYPGDPEYPEEAGEESAEGRGETILEGDIPEGEEPSVGSATVYVAIPLGKSFSGHSRNRPQGVFSSREKAQEAVDKSWATTEGFEFDIIEHTIDEVGGAYLKPAAELAEAGHPWAR